MTLAALRSDATVNKTLTLSGPKAWTVPEVIELCEKLADERAQVTEVSTRSQRGPKSFIPDQAAQKWLLVHSLRLGHWIDPGSCLRSLSPAKSLQMSVLKFRR